MHLYIQDTCFIYYKLRGETLVISHVVTGQWYIRLQ